MSRSAPPRICFFSFTPTQGGTSTYQASQIAFLRERAAVSLVDEKPAHTLAKLGSDDGVEVLELPVWSRRGEAAPALERWLRCWRPEVVAMSNPGMLVRYRGLLRRLRAHGGCRVVLTLHSGALTLTPLRLAMEVASSGLALGADDRVFVSEYTRRYWQRRYPWMRLAASRVVPNGIAIRADAAPRRRSGAALRVGFVGRLHAEKGAALFGAVAERLGGDGFEFHVYGDGPEREAMAARHGRRLVFHGHVRDREGIFAGLDLLLMTSPVENCPYAVLEAKNAGVPTVAPAVGGLGEIVVHGRDGVLARARTPAALAAALDQAAGAYDELSRGCLETRWRFDQARIGREMWDRYL